jgi:hypothetical protein
MRTLRYNTSCYTLVGPVIKSTNGYSPLTGMTSSLIDVNYWYHTTNGGLTSGDYSANNSFTTYGNGYIRLGLTTYETGYPGFLRIEINASDSGIPTFDDFQVVPQNVFDALFSASGTERLQTDAWEITGTGITSASVMMGVNVIQMASAAVSTVTAQIAVNTVMISSVIATQNTIGTGTIYDTMDHGTLMTYLQSYSIGDFGVTGPSTNQVIYKNYSGSTYMMHTFTTKTREWSS